MNKKTGVICYLANRGIINYYDLFKSLFLLKKNFLNYYAYDVIVFHESNFNRTIKLFFGLFFNIKFIEISLNEYYLQNIDNIKIDPELERFGIGYRSMCYFFFLDVFKYIGDYKYYCRLDTDSFLISKVNFDFFEYMESKNLSYGYIAEILESSFAVKGIDKFLNELNLFDSANSQKLFENNKYNLRCFYTNFEIMEIDLINNDSIASFIKKIVQSNNIFQLRWGDAPLRTLMIGLYLKQSKIVRFKSIDYRHQIFVQKDGKIYDNNPVIIEINDNPIAEFVY